MKKLTILFIFIPVIFIASCISKENYGGRMTIDSETGVITPLNQECCYYLAYESLANQNAIEAQKYLKLLETFPQPEGKKQILEEGTKTLWALSYLQEKDYQNALQYMRQLKEVKALNYNQNDFDDEKLYKQLRRVRSASIQLRKSLPALEEYFRRKPQNTLYPEVYANLKKKWHVALQYQKYSAVRDTDYSFPALN